MELASRYVFETKIAFDRQLNKVSRYWFGDIARTFRLGQVTADEKYAYYASYCFDPFTMCFAYDPHFCEGTDQCARDYQVCYPYLEKARAIAF